MEGCFLGIDVGTTNIKAAVFREKGELVAYHSEKTPIVHPIPEQSEFPAEELWGCVCKCVRTVAQAVDGRTIRSVAVSAMAEGGLLLDGNGRPLTDIIAWYDMRSVDECRYLEEKLGKEKIFQITGQTSSAKYGITKLMWLLKNRPEKAKDVEHWLSVEDYTLFRLSGEYATDYSVASRTMAFDIRARQWSETILDCAGVQAGLLPKAYPGGTQIGTVSEAAAEQCGLMPGTPVCTGGHDHACAAISIDILDDGVCMDSMGTAEVSMIAVENVDRDLGANERCYSLYPHCGRKLYRVLTSNQSCGVCIEWALRIFGGDVVERAKALNMSHYDLFLKDLNDGNGCSFFPFLRGTVEKSGVQGAFWGLSDRHTAHDMTSAIINGLCFELKRQISGYEEVFGSRISSLRVVGGLSKSAPIMQRKSTIQGCTVSVPKVTEAACCGAAILGGLGAGLLRWGDPRFVCGAEYRPEEQTTNGRQFDSYLRLREGILKLYERA